MENQWYPPMINNGYGRWPTDRWFTYWK
jgi:hypothetical protein